MMKMSRVIRYYVIEGNEAVKIPNQSNFSKKIFGANFIRNYYQYLEHNQIFAEELLLFFQLGFSIELFIFYDFFEIIFWVYSILIKFKCPQYVIMTHITCMIKKPFQLKIFVQQFPLFRIVVALILCPILKMSSPPYSAILKMFLSATVFSIYCIRGIFDDSHQYLELKVFFYLTVLGY